MDNSPSVANDTLLYGFIGMLVTRSGWVGYRDENDKFHMDTHISKAKFRNGGEDMQKVLVKLKDAPCMLMPKKLRMDLAKFIAGGSYDDLYKAVVGIVKELNKMKDESRT